MMELQESHIAHLKKCVEVACPRCLYLRNMKSWRKKLPWLTDGLYPDPDSDDSDKKLVWGLGCSICARAGLKRTPSMFATNSFAGQGSFSNVKRHEQSKAHKQSVESIGISQKTLWDAPSDEQFAEFMVERR